MATGISGPVDLMDVDLVEQKVLYELMTMRHTACIEQMDYESSFTPSLLSSSNQAVVMQTNSLILVVDTNVLLSNLSFLMELRTILFPNISKILFLIPWVVLQELDYLKASNPSLNKSAREAISFLHQEFRDSSKNVIGQTMDEDLTFVQNMPSIRFSNDDRILHCCLEQTKKWNGVNVLVVMFTNDKNLVTKCEVNSASVVSRKNILYFLRGLTPTPSCAPLSPPHPPPPATPTPSCAYLNNNTSQSNSIQNTQSNTVASPGKVTYTAALDFAISTVRPLLIAFIEDKMKVIFGNLWIQVCFVKPPWSMLDVLSLLEKHWIAVFTDFCVHNVYESITGLKVCLLDAEKYGCSLEHLSYSLEHIQIILQTFSQHIPRCDEMSSIFTGLQREIPNFMSSPPNQGLMSPTETRALPTMQIIPSYPCQQTPTYPSTNYPTPPSSPVNSSSALDWALATILDYIKRIFSSPQPAPLPPPSKDFIILLEKFLLNMDYIASEIPNVSRQNLEGFTNSLNALLSYSVKSSISLHVNTIGSLLSSAESANNIKAEFPKFLNIYYSIVQTN